MIKSDGSKDKLVSPIGAKKIEPDDANKTKPEHCYERCKQRMHEVVSDQGAHPTSANPLEMSSIIGMYNEIKEPTLEHEHQSKKAIFVGARDNPMIKSDGSKDKLVSSIGAKKIEPDDANKTKPEPCYERYKQRMHEVVSDHGPHPTSANPLENVIYHSQGNEPSAKPIYFLLTLKHARVRKDIFLGAVVHAIPTEFLEFYFLNAKDMATCVGVGLHRAKVIINNDLSINIEETNASVRDTWRPFSDNRRHLVMNVGMDIQGNGDDHVQANFFAQGVSRLYGVGIDCASQYVDETYDAAEVSWPLLYDMATLVLKECNETEGHASAQGSGSSQGNIQGINMGDKLHRKRDSVMKRGNLKGGGGDGNEDGFYCNQSVAEGDCPPVVLKVTVYPPTKSDILDTQGMPYGLETACIGPNLVFEFCQNRHCKRISIKTQTRLQLASQMHVVNDRYLFGWYHTDIMISFGCEDRQSGRVAVLKQGSCKILNTRSSYKYTTTRSGTSSNADTFTAGGQASLRLHPALLGSIEAQGSSIGSRTQQEATSNGANMEFTAECLCGGFSFTDRSNTEFPACASFYLSYPLDKTNIWRDKESLKGTGLLSTIEPHIKGTWIPLNGDDASPYLFKAQRSLRLHTKSKDLFRDLKQEYVLPFYVNHAMSHLKSQRSQYIELDGDQQSVSDVLTVGCVY